MKCVIQRDINWAKEMCISVLNELEKGNVSFNGKVIGQMTCVIKHKLNWRKEMCHSAPNLF